MCRCMCRCAARTLADAPHVDGSRLRRQVEQVEVEHAAQHVIGAQVDHVIVVVEILPLVRL